MESNPQDNPIRPAFALNERVVCVNSKADYAFHGFIHRIVKPEEIQELLDRIKLEGIHPIEIINEVLEKYSERDPTFTQSAMYMLIPDGHNRPATFEQAKYIVPGITLMQYNKLMEPRYFMVLESDLFAEDEYNELKMKAKYGDNSNAE